MQRIGLGIAILFGLLGWGVLGIFVWPMLQDQLPTTSETGAEVATLPTVAPTETPIPLVLDDLCPPDQREQFLEQSDRLLIEFVDAYELASSTSRIALSPVVGKMQELYRQIEELDATACGELAQSQMLAGARAAIDAFLAFMQQKPDRTVSEFLLTAESQLLMAKATLSLLQLEPGYGLTPTATPSPIPTKTPRPIPPTNTPVVESTPFADSECRFARDAASYIGQSVCICGQVTTQSFQNKSGYRGFKMDGILDFAVQVKAVEWVVSPPAHIKACGVVQVDSTTNWKEIFIDEAQFIGVPAGYTP
jgi:hypothetical protein